MNLSKWYAGAVRARVHVVCIVATILQLSLGAATTCSGKFDWKQWAVAEAEAMPEVTRSGSRIDQARYLVSRACDKMAELAIAPNNSLADRAAQLPRGGTRGATDGRATGVAQGTCEDVEEILRTVLAAFGLAAGPWRLGVPTSAATQLPPDSWSNHILNVNRNHVAQGLESDWEIYVFDPWTLSHLLSGEGVWQDREKGLQLLRLASKARVPRADTELARYYLSDDGAPADRGAAIELLTDAAARGCAVARNDLAVLYEKGQGVAVNTSQPLKLYRQAAAQGYAQAQYNLARIYFQGTIVAPSPDPLLSPYPWVRFPIRGVMLGGGAGRGNGIVRNGHVRRAVAKRRVSRMRLAHGWHSGPTDEEEVS